MIQEPTEPLIPLRVCLLGAWHLGCVAAACLADHGHLVSVWDSDRNILAGLREGAPPLFEPGLQALITSALGSGRLKVHAELQAAVQDAQYVWITFDTPVDDGDQVDLSGLLAVVEELALLLQPGAMVIVSSQVPVGTCDVIRTRIQDADPDRAFGLVYMPENLRLGHAIQRFRQPDMLVLGADTAEEQNRADQLLSWIQAPRARVGLRTAEMVKHAINAYLATSVAFAGEIAMACDAVGADAVDVAQAIRLDERIGPKARVLPGPGFSGATLARDLRVLQDLGKRYGYSTPLVDADFAVSDRQNRLPVIRLQQSFGVLRRHTFAALGLTYTANTSTLRRSMPVALIEELVQAGAIVRAYDPMADHDEVSRRPMIHRVDSPYTAATGADAILFLTEWPEFRDLDFARIRQLMSRPLIIDAKNMLDPRKVRSLGFEYVGIGRGLADPSAGGSC